MTITSLMLIASFLLAIILLIFLIILGDESACKKNKKVKEDIKKIKAQISPPEE